MNDDLLPDDPAGTVRAGGGIIAVRAPSPVPDSDDTALAWFVFNVDGHQLDYEAEHQRIRQLPIVYQLIAAAR
ncbi:hypothetical protein [Mycobacterium sp. 1465703.0]|uniref:hypothetical protein n=1 Tax=Mycobacterium sp. 1465703.0 TaxID=1834078 RepID=UPI0007FFCA8A|nr:hypothetical protein [Mycobacterium sp. 1465703.0]OBI95557.1 hypothetical protein A5625_08045 [Mycobacterium sp. 1465703.0]